MRQRSTQVVVVPPFGRVVRYRTDAVGNDLTAVLHWCETHHEPVWLYGDVRLPWSGDDHPFGCVTSWGPPINIYGSGDMGQHVCDLASRHRGPHKCRCGAEHKVMQGDAHG